MLIKYFYLYTNTKVYNQKDRLNNKSANCYINKYIIYIQNVYSNNILFFKKVYIKIWWYIIDTNFGSIVYFVIYKK